MGHPLSDGGSTVEVEDLVERSGRGGCQAVDGLAALGREGLEAEDSEARCEVDDGCVDELDRAGPGHHE
jgi:hypothetical protein